MRDQVSRSGLLSLPISLPPARPVFVLFVCVSVCRCRCTHTHSLSLTHTSKPRASESIYPASDATPYGVRLRVCVHCRAGVYLAWGPLHCSSLPSLHHSLSRSLPSLPPSLPPLLARTMSALLLSSRDSPGNTFAQCTTDRKRPAGGGGDRCGAEVRA